MARSCGRSLTFTSLAEDVDTQLDETFEGSWDEDSHSLESDIVGGVPKTPALAFEGYHGPVRHEILLDPVYDDTRDLIEKLENGKSTDYNT